MARTKIALVGDFNPEVTAHQAIPIAVELAAASLGEAVDYEWLHTSDLTDNVSEKLAPFSGIWSVPASPYRNMQGALSAIQYARENQIAFLGTCGGYQHAILEFARNCLGHTDADNAEVNPQTSFPLIAPLLCSLVEKDGYVLLTNDSKVLEFIGQAEIVEQYHCSYGFNPNYIELFAHSELQITGYDNEGEPRVIELTNHPFFIGTAFQPERAALRQENHPLIAAFVAAAILSSVGIEQFVRT